MVDYKKMYQIMVSETERAINILTAAQKKCKEMFIEETDAELTLTKTSSLLVPESEG